MKNSQSQKKRYNIFDNNLFRDNNTAFKTIPFHFDFNPTVTCVIDHTSQTINTYHSKFKKSNNSRHKNKIFDQRRTISEQKSLFGSIEKTSRCGSVCGERNRNHSIFNKSTKPKLSSQRDLTSIKQDQKELKISMVKTQSLPEKEKNSLNKSKEQMKQIYRQELEKKLQFTEKQRKWPNRQISQQPVVYKNEVIVDILKPEQFARMIKQVRTVSKNRRNQHIYHVPRILSQVPQRFPKKKEGLVYRI